MPELWTAKINSECMMPPSGMNGKLEKNIERMMSAVNPTNKIKSMTLTSQRKSIKSGLKINFFSQAPAGD